MELLLEQEHDVDEIVYPPQEKCCNKCKLLLTWVAVWSLGFSFGFITKSYLLVNDELCNGSM
jgi:hypothetical protein